MRMSRGDTSPAARNSVQRRLADTDTDGGPNENDDDADDDADEKGEPVQQRFDKGDGAPPLTRASSIVTRRCCVCTSCFRAGFFRFRRHRHRHRRSQGSNSHRDHAGKQQQQQQEQQEQQERSESVFNVSTAPSSILPRATGQAAPPYAAPTGPSPTVTGATAVIAAVTAVATTPPPPPMQMQLSALVKSRRRRKIRQVLDRVARAVSSPHLAHEASGGLALFSDTDCAVLTSAGEVIAARSGSARPLAALAPRLRHAAAAAASLAAQLGCAAGAGAALHLRGRGALLLVYALGQSHALVAATQVSPGARELDAVVARIDAALGAAPQPASATVAANAPLSASSSQNAVADSIEPAPPSLVAELTELLRDL